MSQSKRDERTDIPSAHLSTFPSISTCGPRRGSTLTHTLTHRLNWSKSKEEVLFSLKNRTSWSCWADSNRRPHPYQEIFDNFYNNFYLFLVIFVPNNVVSRTFEKCSLRCFHICLWWNCGQAAILRIRPLIVKVALRNLGYKVRNHIRCISISYSPDFFTLYTAFFSQYIIECL